MLRTAVVVPVLNASKDWDVFSSALRDNLATANMSPSQVLVIDSSSSDGTADLVRSAGYRLHVIPREEFNHGLTRQLALNLMTEAELFVYLTQDAILATPDSLKVLCGNFDKEQIAAAYGRQLPRSEATAIETHARLFNYSSAATVRALANRDDMGFKSIFFSNSFGAYRRTALESVGGFASDIIFGEDTVLVARLHLEGWQTAYIPAATVFHSHSYSYTEEFKRYFDIGVLHARENWLLADFGRPTGEGKKFVLSECKFLSKYSPLSIPSALIRTFLKVVAYRLGRNENSVPNWIKKMISLNSTYWENRSEPKISEAHSHKRVETRT